MPRSGCQLRVRDPQILLLLPLLARAHRHAPILRTNPVDTPELSAYESRLTPRAVKTQSATALAPSSSPKRPTGSNSIPQPSFQRNTLSACRSESRVHY